MRNITIIVLALVFILSACHSAHEKTVHPGKEAAILLHFLHDAKGKGTLFGHQDDLAYGIGWKYVDGESDTKRTAGDYPALFGWELGGLELGHVHNLDSVPFDQMRNFAIWVHENGGVNTFSWHPYSALDTTKSSWVHDTRVVEHILAGGSHYEQFKVHLDKVADFFHSLKTSKGEPVPFIFRPWHEMDGGWFWWGSDTTTPAELQQLFRYTIEYLRDEKGLKNLLSAYSPDRNFNSEAEYLTWYPGDDVVDVIGVDNYWDFRTPDGLQNVVKKLEIAVNYANKTGKVAAFTETGSDGIRDTTWYTHKLYASLNASELTRQIVYAMVWRNRDLGHFYVPHPEHHAADDFREFTQKENIWLLNDWRKFKAEHRH
jgi:mannan endo-1,4-beta-mannosidase